METKNYKELFDNIVEFTADYIKRNNLMSAVLGISGGIDSTVVAAILYEANKRHSNDKCNLFSFIGYSLPTSTTNDDEYYVSTLVGNTFASYFGTMSIDTISGTVFNTFNVVNGSNISDNGFTSTTTKFRRGNIKARLRMMFLYDTAKVNNGFVVGTDNYTEKLLGFSTIGGDALADYMPLQNLWKTDVYGIAKYLVEKYKEEKNWAAVHAISESINLAPQDGLGISSSDMDQIGAKNYYDVDEILKTYERYLEYINMGGDTSMEKRFEMFKEVKDKFGVDVVANVVNRREKNFKLNLPIIYME
jgi:NAD+ synthetase